MKYLAIGIVGAVLLGACATPVAEAPEATLVAAPAAPEAAAETMMDATVDETAMAAPSVIDIAAVTAALASAETRPAAEKERDAGRKPADVLAFLGLKPGDTAADFIASGGWYTEVLSIAVGPDGTVYAQNSEAALELNDRAYDKALTARLEGGRLANVVRKDDELSALTIPAGSVDVAITALNFHDVYNAYGPEAAVGFLAAIRTTLKPGGVLGLIDHVGAPDGANTDLHRIDPALAIASAEAAGFVVEAQSNVLSNDTDDHTKLVFDPEVRGQTDRFVLKLTNPA
ncbi:class I SAM-dependent methyltransferase [Hyphomonas johnsonii]|uniref:Methyltransferase n=1 Tax=Hyphomonas johnsonii MHS-2 TaxID=1280950 RepID=A0A059FFW6_9PROT|nr:class I SAM-dependent methyltransferase [Hyphomonas johnsonii]KCZ89413.1 methyltransferase [Hyphomonas johnsonii MHS-2]